jgi:6-pyruvoyltetrahydropterin/6-carboxytetrahydropterin synthase
MPEALIEKIMKSETAHIVKNAVSTRCRFSVHGHSYIWEIALKGLVDDNTGMVLDFKELKPIKDFVDDFDHATVFAEEEDKEVIEFFYSKFERVLVMKKNCTAENMARALFKFTNDFLEQKYKDLIKVVYARVRETTTGAAVAFSCNENDIIVKSYKTANYVS